MKAFITLLTLFSLFVCSYQTVFARGWDVGNGGDVVLCPGEQPEVLDVHEAKQRNPNYKLDFATSSANGWLAESINQVLTRIQLHDPERYKHLSFLARRFFSHHIYDRNRAEGMLWEVEDEGEYTIAEGCRLKQAAVFNTRGQTHVDIKVWQLLSPRQKVVLILHEVIYMHAVLKHRHQTSQNTRKLVTLLSSGEITNFSKEQYRALMRELDFID